MADSKDTKEKAKAAKAKDNASQQQSVTVNFPSTVNVGVTGQLEVKPQEKHREQFYESPEFWVAAFTGLLVFVTAYLVHYTKNLWSITKKVAEDAKATSDRQATEMKAALDISKQSADAATESASSSKSAFLATHRPRIRVRHVWGVGKLEKDEKLGVAVQIVNTGVTRAKIIDYSARLWVAPQGKLLPMPPEYQRAVIVNNEPFLESGQSTTLPPMAEHVLTISDDENTNIRNTRYTMHCFGYVRYEDGERRVRTTAFYRKLRPPTNIAGAMSEIGRFMELESPDPDYEYED